MSPPSVKGRLEARGRASSMGAKGHPAPGPAVTPTQPERRTMAAVVVVVERGVSVGRAMGSGTPEQVEVGRGG